MIYTVFDKKITLSWFSTTKVNIFNISINFYETSQNDISLLTLFHSDLPKLHNLYFGCSECNRIKARIFLLVDLREFFSDLGSGDEKNK